MAALRADVMQGAPVGRVREPVGNGLVIEDIAAVALGQERGQAAQRRGQDIFGVQAGCPGQIGLGQRLGGGDDHLEDALGGRSWPCRGTAAEEVEVEPVQARGQGVEAVEAVLVALDAQQGLLGPEEIALALLRELADDLVDPIRPRAAIAHPSLTHALALCPVGRAKRDCCAPAGRGGPPVRAPRAGGPGTARCRRGCADPGRRSPRRAGR